jgi:hypothetical protein
MKMDDLAEKMLDRIQGKVWTCYICEGQIHDSVDPAIIPPIYKSHISCWKTNHPRGINLLPVVITQHGNAKAKAQLAQGLI